MIKPINKISAPIQIKIQRGYYDLKWPVNQKNQGVAADFSKMDYSNILSKDGLRPSLDRPKFIGKPAHGMTASMSMGIIPPDLSSINPRKKKTPSVLEGVHWELPDTRWDSHRFDCSYSIESFLEIKEMKSIC